MAALPFGFRFRPTHQDLLYILWCKVSGKPFFCNGAVVERDIYNQEELEDIFMRSQNNKKEVLYFFTKLKKKGGNGTKRIDRTVGMGTWKAQQKTDIKGGGGWKNFSYENRESMEHKLWTMVEYFLADNNDYVLCRIKKHDRDKKKGVVNDQMQPQQILPDQLMMEKEENIYRDKPNTNLMGSIEQHLLGEDFDISREVQDGTNHIYNELLDIVNNIGGGKMGVVDCDMQPEPILTDQLMIENWENIYRNTEGQRMSNSHTYGELLDLANNDYMQPGDQMLIEMDPNLCFDLDELLDIVNNDHDMQPVDQSMIETGPNLCFQHDELLDTVNNIGQGKEAVAIEENMQPDQIFKDQQMIEVYDEHMENQSITNLEQQLLDDFDEWLVEKEQ